ncbi:AAA family ATPase [Flavobacterium sp. RSSB_23]|uniref:AAA family ATPase n=1 Tax=Flavobacterium sp. RSSB_23 TaxID=3447668 RepID=UPI003F366F8D
MQIEKLVITNLHGYINKEIDFNDDLTLLVGINGSGKTSILNVINWVISPSLPNLCVTEFEKIVLNFTFKKTAYEVTCEHHKTTFSYKIKTNKIQYHPLTIRIHQSPSTIKNDTILRDSLIQNYTGLAPDEKEKETWELISNFPNPTIIGLDRNLYTEESSEQIYYEEGIKGRLIRKHAGNVTSPLDRVKEIINKEYRKRKNAILNLTNGLKNHLMLSTFDGSITQESLHAGIRYKLNLSQITNAEKRVNDYFVKFEENSITLDEQKTIAKYFSQLKEITVQYQSEPTSEIVKLLYGLNANQFIKVRKLLKEFENFEAESIREMSQIQDYIDVLNHFLKDSAKKILFKEDTSELTFSTLDKNGKVITEYKDINYLSSGEQQILILFSYIAFNSKDGRIFIIDEPELSLHIKWQEDFLEKLNKITPKFTQLILATHSPILAGKRKDKTVVLLPYNV